MFSCPCCKCEYTPNICNDNINKVLAKIYFKIKGVDFVHYITNPIEIISYVPCSEITADGHISAKWVEILDIMRTSWEIGDMDIYAVIRLTPEPEYILCNNRLKIPPLDPLTGSPKNNIKHRDLKAFRMVEAEEINLLINDI